MKAATRWPTLMTGALVFPDGTFGDRRKIEVLPASPAQQNPGKIVDMQPLHHHDDRTCEGLSKRDICVVLNRGRLNYFVRLSLDSPVS